MDLKQYRADLRCVLEDAGAWLQALVTAEIVPPGEVSSCQAEIEVIRRLRTRAASSLINIALFGAFSGGKSFLISGLQGRLIHAKLPNSDGTLSDRYVGILPSKSSKTTSCPARVVPVEKDGLLDAGGRGFLRVRFADDIDDGSDPRWIDIGPNQVPAVISAYGAVTGDVTSRPLQDHWDRKVAEIEISISDYKLNAMFYDLPGIGSDNPIHDAIAKDALLDADCILYVTQATTALSSEELKLISFLYQHHVATKKKIIWGLTGIDRADQKDDGERHAWEDTLDANNTFLRDRFGTPDTFFGQGFIPVSPALEAKAATLRRGGHKERANSVEKQSRMGDLRRQLTTMINEETGPRHVSKIAAEAYSIIARRQGPLSDTLRTHRSPVDDLAAQHAQTEQQLDRIGEITSRTQSQLDSELKRRIRAVETEFRELRSVLHNGLDDLIRSLNPFKEEDAGTIVNRRAELFEDWMASEQGPATLWRSQLDEFTREAINLVRAQLGEETQNTIVTQAPLSRYVLSGPRPSRDPLGPFQRLQIGGALLAATSGATTGVLGVLSAAGVTTWAVASFLVPGAVFIAAGTAAVYAAAAFKERQTLLDQYRNEWIQQLDELADSYPKTFTDLATGEGQRIIDNVSVYLDEYRGRLHTTLFALAGRMSAPDTLRSQEIVARLEPFEARALEIIRTLRQLSPETT